MKIVSIYSSQKQGGKISNVSMAQYYVTFHVRNLLMFVMS